MQRWKDSIRAVWSSGVTDHLFYNYGNMSYLHLLPPLCGFNVQYVRVCVCGEHVIQLCVNTVSSAIPCVLIYIYSFCFFFKLASLVKTDLNWIE